MDTIPMQGFSADYVYCESKRAFDALTGTKSKLLPGIDIDIPRVADHANCTPEGTKGAVLAAFRAVSHGVILSWKYSKLQLANLKGAGAALRGLGLA